MEIEELTSVLLQQIINNRTLINAVSFPIEESTNSLYVLLISFTLVTSISLFLNCLFALSSICVYRQPAWNLLCVGLDQITDLIIRTSRVAKAKDSLTSMISSPSSSSQNTMHVDDAGYLGCLPIFWPF